MNEFQWPDGRRCAVSLTFDMDGETISYVVDRDNASERLALMSEFAYGPKVGIYHILELLELYEIQASFFVPGYVIELHPEAIEAIVKHGHDLGHHGYMHERPDSLSDEQEAKILEKGIEVIESMTGAKPKAYRSPAWELKPSSPELLLKYGFEYDSSLMGYDIPYWISTPSGKLLELPVHWKADDWPQFGFVSVPPVGSGISAPSKAFEVFSQEFEGIYNRGGFFNMTMHPFLSGRPSGLAVLERLIRYIRGFPRVWWAPLSEIAEYCASSDVAEFLPVDGVEIPPYADVD